MDIILLKTIYASYVQYKDAKYVIVIFVLSVIINTKWKIIRMVIFNVFNVKMVNVNNKIIKE